MGGRLLRMIIVVFVGLLALTSASVAYAAPVIADSFSVPYPSTGISINANYPALAQTFTAIDGTLDSATVSLQCLGSFPGTVQAELYAVTGTFGADASPVGTPLAVSPPLTPSSTGGAYDSFTFAFDNSVTLSAGEHYALVLNSTGAPADSGLSWGMQWSSPFPGDHAAYYAPGGYWNTSNLGSPDFIFAVYETPSASPTPVVGVPASDWSSIAALIALAFGALVFLRRQPAAS